jgi:signal transduction histidine kinase
MCLGKGVGNCPMNLLRVWERISRSGIVDGLDVELERKVILCNQIGFTIGSALFIGATNHLAWGYTVLAPFMMVFAFLYFLVPYLNLRGHHTLSRVALTAIPPLLVILLSGLILYRDSSFKFAMIPIILVPILVFGITERTKMLAGIIWIVLAFLTMDVITPFIPRLEGVTITAGEIAQNAKINGLITFFMFSASFIYFQRLNQRAERTLSETLQEVRKQKEIIERQKEEEQQQAASALAQQREVNALKSTFVAMTSHEFRTPLAAIHSSQELLRDFGEKMDVTERSELFEIIDSSVHRMTVMLDKILILGQADADLMGFEPKPVNIQQICELIIADTVKSSRGHTLIGSAITLRNQLPANEMAMLDESLLRHSLGNLLSNAIKYSPQGGQAILEVNRVSTAIVFEVIDQGIGIPEKDVPHLFESFHRASNVGTIQGTGLGLAIVMRAIVRHGGKINVSSEEGKGTRFVVSIPQPLNTPT